MFKSLRSWNVEYDNLSKDQPGLRFALFIIPASISILGANLIHNGFWLILGIMGLLRVPYFFGVGK